MRIASEIMTLANANARKSAPKDLGLDLLILKEKKWRPDPKGCFKSVFVKWKVKAKVKVIEKKGYTPNICLPGNG